MKFSASLLVAGFSLALAAPRHWTRQHQAFESIPGSREGWEVVNRAHPDQLIDLRIALRESGDISQHLYEIADPNHERYGQHLTKEDIDDLTSASTETYGLVQEWLRSHGILKAHTDSNWVNVRVPISVAEEMLQAEYHVYTDGKAQIVRTTGYSLPARLHEHVDLVSPTIYFGRAGRALASTIMDESASALDSSDIPSFPYEEPQLAYGGLCNSTNVTLECLAKDYGYENYTSKAADKNSFGITAFLGEHLNFADLSKFLRTFAPEAAGANYTVVLVNNGTNPQDPADEGEGEAALDVQEALGIAYPAKGTFWSTAGVPPIWPDELTSAAINSAGMGNEDYLAWVQYVLAQKSVPYVISTSYDDDEQTVPFSYATRVCSEFAKLGARGVTLLFSAGDFGPGGVQPNNCTVNDGSNRHEFLPAFPSTCPFVTAVGGVTGFQSEQYVTIFPRGGGSGGGGFSNYFSRPSYQPKDTIDSYLNKVDYEKYRILPFNKEGRAYPDISFNGRNFSIFFNGSNVRISGTSASAPGLAGFLTLLNDGRLAANKTPIGFLNPLLYSGKLSGDAFRDTTIGSNPAFTPGCNYTLGFPALEGWDAATGFGAPVFQSMLEQVLALP